MASVELLMVPHKGLSTVIIKRPCSDSDMLRRLINCCVTLISISVPVLIERAKYACYARFDMLIYSSFRNYALVLESPYVSFYFLDF